MKLQGPGGAATKKSTELKPPEGPLPETMRRGR